MKLRILPWFVDDCSLFLNNLFKWLPLYLDRPLRVLEVGGGNSTLFFLQKGCSVLTIENDRLYAQCILDIAAGCGYAAMSTSEIESLPHDSQHDLKILTISEIGKFLGSCQEFANFDIVVNDGIYRKEVLHALREKNAESIILLDNVEYCANYGKLERCSAHPGRVLAYREMLRDPNWRHYIFEQKEGANGYSMADYTGFEAPHRWMSAVLWPTSHFLSKFMITSIGFPVVTSEGIDDDDVRTLASRCPFDWEAMRWEVDSYSNTFRLNRTRC